MIRVVLADDQELVRDGIRMILEAQDDIEVVAEAGDGEEALRAVAHSRPDVVVMDIRMPGVDGLRATRSLTSTPDSPRVLILTTFGTDEYLYRALKSGASGFLLKDAPRRRLVDAIRSISRGDSLVDPALTWRLVERWAARPPASVARAELLDALSPRELEVFDGIVSGRSNAEIGSGLYLSESTVKTHVGQVLRKLGLRDRVQAVIFAHEHGLVRDADA
jgi:DNA-binding NarL/FixJ family response regulator